MLVRGNQTHSVGCVVSAGVERLDRLQMQARVLLVKVDASKSALYRDSARAAKTGSRIQADTLARNSEPVTLITNQSESMQISSSRSVGF